MDNAFTTSRPGPLPRGHKLNRRLLAGVATAGLLVVAVVIGQGLFGSGGQPPSPPPPSVTVSAPLQQAIDTRLQLLGQFAAVDHLELRAQVGGTLTRIGFKDGDVVHKGDLLFEIDPTPYEIKLSQAEAQLESAWARLDLASRESVRSEALRRTGAGSVETNDKSIAEKRAAQAAVGDAEAMVRDARFDLDHCRIVAPFTGRIGTHMVSVGNLVSGSRAGSSPTTLLTTLVSVDPIYLNFDMSEADYMTFLRDRQKQTGPLAEKVQLSLSDEKSFGHEGTLDFVDNALDRSSGTIHARATIPNTDLLLTPGAFARVRVQVSAPAPALLIPDSAVLPDQSDHVVLTLGPDDVVAPKQVEVGDLRDGLRVIRKGLLPSDQVIIDGIPSAKPGAKVSPHYGLIRFAADQTKG